MGYFIGLHNELRKVNESEPVQFTTLSEVDGVTRLR